MIFNSDIQLSVYTLFLVFYLFVQFSLWQRQRMSGCVSDAAVNRATNTWEGLTKVQTIFTKTHIVTNKEQVQVDDYLFNEGL